MNSVPSAGHRGADRMNASRIESQTRTLVLRGKNQGYIDQQAAGVRLIGLPVIVIVTSLVEIIVAGNHVLMATMIDDLRRVIIPMARVVPMSMWLYDIGLYKAVPMSVTMSIVVTAESAVSAATRLRRASEDCQSRNNSTRGDNCLHLSFLFQRFEFRRP